MTYHGRAHPSAESMPRFLAVSLITLLGCCSALMPTAPPLASARRTLAGRRVRQTSPHMDDGSIQIPSTLDAVCEEARKSLQQALASGKRGLRVEAGVPSLDASSQAYEPAMMARFALEISAALTFLDGPLLLLLPGLSAVNAAREMLEEGGIPKGRSDKAKLKKDKTLASVRV